MEKHPEAADRHWHNGGYTEIASYARSLHQVGQGLIAALDLSPRAAWNACPVILLYRQAVELQLKFLVEEGGDLLPEPTDPITLCKTHSLRWLAQIVCQIIRAVKWEAEFKCEGIAGLADFSSLVDELELLDPVAVVVQSKNRRPDGWVPDQLLPRNLVRVATKLDALLDLLVATTDGLAAVWDLRQDHCVGDDPNPTIQ
jgi:hypothetical protein